MSDSRAGGTLKRPSPLGNDVYNLLLTQLMSLQLPPGSRISVDNLAREVGVSQTPIREALGRLEIEGLVIKTHLIGYSVAPQLNRREFEELYELRMLLEPPAAAKAAKRMTKEGLAALMQLADSMRTSPGSNRQLAYSQFALRDAEFHDHIISAGDNALIRQTLARLHVHVHLFRLFYDLAVTDEAIAEHAGIIDALANRNSSAVAVAVRRHISQSRIRFMRVFFRSQLTR